MSEGGREQENSRGNISQKEEKEEGEGEKRVEEGEISEGERKIMSTDCASPIGKSAHSHSHRKGKAIHTVYVPEPFNDKKSIRL